MELTQKQTTGIGYEIFEKFWNTNQGWIIQLGKNLLLTLIIVIIAAICVKIARKLIVQSPKKLVKIDDSIYKVCFTVVRVVIWLVAALITLDIFGFNTASLLTILGAAGLTVGLAMKDSMSNIASGVMLLVLRPYKTGDFVACGSTTGTIKEMGLFSTVMETFEGIFVSVPNNAIFGNPITNYSRNPMRRAVITVGISYGDSLQKGLEVLREMLEKNELILKDPAPEVLVADLADSSVNLTIRFWADNANYWTAYWQVKEQIKSTIEDAGLNIPFPQRVVTVVNQEK
ncbi:MAG: mechanosensitive ion channel family protein [Lentisphaeria bacterium]|nr:mechanosensitive ion channel family protein [Lentisphaeria bacterium]